MEDLQILLASIIVDAMTQSDLIQQLKDAIIEYESTNEPKYVIHMCHMILHKYKIDEHGGVKEMMTEYENFKKINEAFVHTQNKS